MSPTVIYWYALLSFEVSKRNLLSILFRDLSHYIHQLSTSYRMTNGSLSLYSTRITVQELSCKIPSLLFMKFASEIFDRFLVEGSHGAVLHTGDFRCETVFIDSLRKNLFLQRYISQPDPEHPDVYIKPAETLDSIFIDTENLFANYRVLSKVSGFC